MTNKLHSIYVVRTSNIEDDCYYVTMKDVLDIVKDFVNDGYTVTVRLDKVTQDEWKRRMATMEAESAAPAARTEAPPDPRYRLGSFNMVHIVPSGKTALCGSNGPWQQYMPEVGDTLCAQCRAQQALIDRAHILDNDNIAPPQPAAEARGAVSHAEFSIERTAPLLFGETTSTDDPALVPAEARGDVATLKEYRKDGWPLCPQCGEDELMSYLAADYVDEYAAEHDSKPPISDYIKAGMHCLMCGWGKSATQPKELNISQERLDEIAKRTQRNRRHQPPAPAASAGADGDTLRGGKLSAPKRKQLALVADHDLSYIRVANNAPKQHKMMLEFEKAGLVETYDVDRHARGYERYWRITDAGREALRRS